MVTTAQEVLHQVASQTGAAKLTDGQEACTEAAAAAAAPEVPLEDADVIPVEEDDGWIDMDGDAAAAESAGADEETCSEAAHTSPVASPEVPPGFRKRQGWPNTRWHLSRCNQRSPASTATDHENPFPEPAEPEAVPTSQPPEVTNETLCRVGQTRMVVMATILLALVFCVYHMGFSTRSESENEVALWLKERELCELRNELEKERARAQQQAIDLQTLKEELEQKKAPQKFSFKSAMAHGFTACVTLAMAVLVG
eukprot:GGOE01003307.1.p1 GENE.GGOE01003307.1~~GGOE01003307.1.p1  ORF type:complete len:272 (-),score=45.89 GGOE01003307.1:472-1236(-)